MLFTLATPQPSAEITSASICYGLWFSIGLAMVTIGVAERLSSWWWKCLQEAVYMKMDQGARDGQG